MKILLIGEGASELGGALEILVRRLGHSDAVIESDRISQQQIHAHHGKGQGYFKRAVRWMFEAAKRGYDAIVLVIDHDGKGERPQEIHQAQHYVGSSIRRALGVAVRTFDAWMLADEVALTQVLGTAIPCQPNPEDMRDPKRVCGELLESSNCSITPVQMYALIARHIDIDVLNRRCDTGFAPFARRVRKL